MERVRMIEAGPDMVVWVAAEGEVGIVGRGNFLGGGSTLMIPFVRILC
jgi:hypothetical protein